MPFGQERLQAGVGRTGARVDDVFDAVFAPILGGGLQILRRDIQRVQLGVIADVFQRPRRRQGGIAGEDADLDRARRALSRRMKNSSTAPCSGLICMRAISPIAAVSMRQRAIAALSARFIARI
jgi:hypothetical protein